MSDYKQPKTLFIDWFGTLCNTLPLQQIGNPSHPAYISSDTIRNAIYANKDSMRDLMRGKMSLQRFCNLIAAETDLPAWSLVHEYSVSFSNFKWADDDLPLLLQRVRKSGVKTVLVADSFEPFTRFTIPKMKLDSLFDHILVSHSVGFLKFDTDYDSLQFFQTYIETHKLRYGDCLLIDDNPNERLLGDFGMPYVKIEGIKDLKMRLNHIIHNVPI